MGFSQCCLPGGSETTSTFDVYRTDTHTTPQWIYSLILKFHSSLKQLYSQGLKGENNPNVQHQLNG